MSEERLTSTLRDAVLESISNKEVLLEELSPRGLVFIMLLENF